MNWPEWTRNLSPDIYAWVQLAVAAISVWLLWCAAKRLVRLGYFLFFSAIGFVIIYIVQPMPGHGGVPLQYAIVGGILFGAICTAIRSRIFRIAGAVATIALFYFVSDAVVSGVGRDHSSLTTVHPISDKRLAQVEVDDLKQGRFSEIISDHPKVKTVPKGWLSEPPFADWGLYVREFWSVERHPYWHTWLTGIVESKSKKLDIWCPGGTIKKAQAGLELREREVKQ